MTADDFNLDVCRQRQREAREAGDLEALAYWSQLRWRGIVQRDPEAMRRGYVLVRRDGSLVLPTPEAN